MEATIEVSGLRKRFGPTLALDGMSFTVQPGQVTGFVGPNGAGKSTTMRVILGLDAADEGTARSAASPTRACGIRWASRGTAGRGRAAAEPQPPATTCSGWRTRRAWTPGGWTR